MKSLLVLFRVFLILLALLVLPFTVAAKSGIQSPLATDRYVSPTGEDIGGCTNPANPCQTITYARQQSASGDTIHLAPGEYFEIVSLFIGLNLVGAGADVTSIDGSTIGPVVYVYPDQLATTSISHLTIRNGAAQNGAGLYTFGELTLDHVIIEDNHATSSGGGIYNEGDLTILNSIVRNNTSLTVAAGMINHTTAVIHNSSFIGNQVAEGGYYAGGIHNNSEATMQLTNVTISGNKASSSGGLSNSGTADLVNVTIAHNIGDGIGLFNLGSAVNTIVDGNTPNNCAASVTVPSLGNNLDRGVNCGFVEPGDLQDTPALLQPLGYYSSPIPTHSLLVTSPALDSANGTYCPATDARGVARPIDGDGTGGPACDRGAHEYNPATDGLRLYLPLVGKSF